MGDVFFGVFLAAAGVFLGLMLGVSVVESSTVKDCRELGGSRLGGTTITCQVEGSQ